MAAKRLFNDSDDQEPDKPSDKRTRNTRPSFASVIGEVVMVKNLENMFSALEPVIKRVVGEEVERVMRQLSRSFTRSPSLRLQAMEQPSNLQLCFNKKLFLPIFTGSRILDNEGNPMTVVLMDKSNGQVIPTSVQHIIKLEIVVIDGDFQPSDNEDWTREEFNRHIVKERSGKRPLLAGEMNLTMKDGIAPIGDIEFTDNSSWIRCRKFRVAVRVAPAAGSNQAVRIREAITEAFIVKDHRGELYKKHHPPMLDDDVWRLEKIGKDGAFHRKLLSEGIKTVQDFVKLANVDYLKLRNILGVGMSDKMWEVTSKHAMTCEMGNKIYIYRGPQFAIFLDPLCKLIRADINGQTFSNRDPMGQLNTAYIGKLVRDAYARWHNLEEIDHSVLNDNIALLTQGDQTVEQFPNNQPAASMVTYDQNQYYSGKSTSYEANSNAQIGSCEWSLNQAYNTSPFAHGFPLTFPVSQSDGDITASGSGSLDIDEATRQI